LGKGGACFRILRRGGLIVPMKLLVDTFKKFQNKKKEKTVQEKVITLPPNHLVTHFALHPQ